LSGTSYSITLEELDGESILASGFENWVGYGLRTQDVIWEEVLKWSRL